VNQPDIESQTDQPIQEGTLEESSEINSQEEKTTGARNYFEELIQSGKYDYYFERGQIVPGKVIFYQKDGALVNIGTKSEAFLPNKEIADQYLDDYSEVLPLEKDLEFFILRDEAGAGYDGRIILSYKRVSQAKSWVTLEEKNKPDQIFEAHILEVVKGGVVVTIDGIKGFIPASHLRVKGGSGNPNLVDQTIPCTILEIDRQQSKLILSQKIAISKLYAEERQKLLLELADAIKDYERRLAQGEQDLEPVKVVGEVVRITDFGAFIKIKDSEMDGLLPLSEISWRKVSYPGDILKIGQEVEVIVLNVVPEQSRISLSLKRQTKDPWERIKQVVKEGDVVSGKVSKVINFGVFIQIQFEDPELVDCGFEALLPVVEIKGVEVGNEAEILDKFTLGEVIKVLIYKVKPEDRKITLSTKHLGETESSKESEN